MKVIKSTLILFLSIFILTNTFAAKAKGSVEGPVKEKEEEVSSEKNGNWYLYIEDAHKESEKTGKPILANFTGSDWCGWCIRLKNEVFKTEEFNKWAKENVVLLELDYPRKTQLPEDLAKQNASLQQAFQIQGYPTIWVFNLSFKDDSQQYNIDALGKTGYVAGGPSEWIKKTEAFIK